MKNKNPSKEREGKTIYDRQFMWYLPSIVMSAIALIISIVQLLK